MIRPADFDPLTFDGEFTVMAQGHIGVWIVPLLLDRLRETAPGLRLNVLAGSDAPLELLGTCELDFVVHAVHKSYPDGFRLTTLGYAQPVLLARGLGDGGADRGAPRPPAHS